MAIHSSTVSGIRAHQLGMRVQELTHSISPANKIKKFFNNLHHTVERQSYGRCRCCCSPKPPETARENWEKDESLGEEEKQQRKNLKFLQLLCH